VLWVGVNVQTTSRGWRSALLASLMTAAIAAFCGVLPAAGWSTHAVASDAQCGTPPSHQWTAAQPDSNSRDLFDDDDGDNDDALGAALPPVPTTVTADPGRTLLSTPNVIDRRLFFASDGHSLRAPPQ
jgi:hypothetical protein